MGRQYTEEEKAAALALLKMMGGNITQTAQRLNMPRQTLSEWAALFRRDSPQNNLTRFKTAIVNNYLDVPHLKKLDAALIQVTRYIETGGKEGIGRLIVEFPPRYGKTLVTSRLYPIWHLGRNPTHRIMLVSYGASLAEKNSRAARRLIKAKAYREIFDLELAKDSQSVQAWDIAGHEGGVDALGIGGSATGKGCHLLILDDPVKNREEAESAVYRDKVWEAFTDDLYTRLEPGGAVVVMATRWHHDDLIGRILKQDTGGKWIRLRLPAIAEENDPLGRTVGEALWPERFPIETLHEIRQTLGDYSFSALYQQNPVPAEGGIFKRVWFESKLDEPPRIVRAWRFWDLAMSERTSADYTAGVKIGRDRDGVYYVLDVGRGQVAWENLADFIAGVILQDGEGVTQGIEMKGYMSRAVKDLNNDPRFHRFSILGFNVDHDKLTRALPFAAKCGAGMVRVLHRHWTEAYVEELCSFPNGAHDDQVDASSGAWAMAAEDDGGGLRFTETRYA